MRHISPFKGEELQTLQCDFWGVYPQRGSAVAENQEFIVETSFYTSPIQVPHWNAENVDTQVIFTHFHPWIILDKTSMAKEVYSHCLPLLHPTLSIHCSNHSLETSQQTSLPMIDSMLNNFPDECWLQVFAAVNTYTTALHSKRDPINMMMPFWGGKSVLAIVPPFSGFSILLLGKSTIWTIYASYMHVIACLWLTMQIGRAFVSGFWQFDFNRAGVRCLIGTPNPGVTLQAWHWELMLPGLPDHLRSQVRSPSGFRVFFCFGFKYV